VAVGALPSNRYTMPVFVAFRAMQSRAASRLRNPCVVLGSRVRSIPFERSLLPLIDKPRSQAVQGTPIRPGAVRKLARLFHSGPVSRHAFERSFGQRWLPARPRAARPSVRGRPARLAFPALARCVPGKRLPQEMPVSIEFFALRPEAVSSRCRTGSKGSACPITLSALSIVGLFVRMFQRESVRQR
jgi:hypothetical protein